MHDVPGIRAKFEALRPYLDERRRRLWAAAEAMVLGRGGITAVANATGLERNTIRAGIRELQANPTASAEPEAEAAAAADRVRRVRAVGGGRKPLTTEDPTLVQDLEALVEPVTRGDPMSPLRWTCKSTRQLAAELVRQGHQVSHQTVADLLHSLDYSLQGTRKTREGAEHPDRDAQFAYLNDQTRAFQQRGQPIRVCHFPPGTSKWNAIEHRLFCHITQNWRGRPLVSLEVIVNLIGNTTTRAGLKVRAELDPAPYPTGVKVADAEFATVQLEPATFHGNWNYAITP